MAGIRVTIWNEHRHEQTDAKVQAVYPDGIHAPIAKYLSDLGHEVHVSTLDDDDCGLTPEVLDNTDVLIWWGHTAHNLVMDDIVDRIQARVLAGMGFIALHSSHESKPFMRLMGTSCGLLWRDIGEKEKLWVTNPYHPISKGIDAVIELDHEEMYGECFDVPNPDDVVFTSWFEGGNVFRSGCTWHRGRGKIFYFRPGHEAYPTYYNKEILHVIANAVEWAKFDGNTEAAGIGKAANMPFLLAPVEKNE
ncbi:MAG TPA: ThuA domain-containing protein [Candidatus Lokiarchaeia archaeon]|nr:ThuA domain-containing protein [Candidatus Lokiarchaeia archaeon]